MNGQQQASGGGAAGPQRCADSKATAGAVEFSAARRPGVGAPGESGVGDAEATRARNLANGAGDNSDRIAELCAGRAAPAEAEWGSGPRGASGEGEGPDADDGADEGAGGPPRSALDRAGGRVDADAEDDESTDASDQHDGHGPRTFPRRGGASEAEARSHVVPRSPHSAQGPPSASDWEPKRILNRTLMALLFLLLSYPAILSARGPWERRVARAPPSNGAARWLTVALQHPIRTPVGLLLLTLALTRRAAPAARTGRGLPGSRRGSQLD